MTDPKARRDEDDAATEHGADKGVASWNEATSGARPEPGTEEFARTREGFGQAAEDGTLAEAAERGTNTGEDPSAG